MIKIMNKVIVDVHEIIESADLNRVDKLFCTKCLTDIFKAVPDMIVNNLKVILPPSEDTTLIDIRFEIVLESLPDELKIRSLRKIISDSTKKHLREDLDSQIFKIQLLDLYKPRVINSEN